MSIFDFVKRSLNTFSVGVMTTLAVRASENGWTVTATITLCLALVYAINLIPKGDRRP